MENANQTSLTAEKIVRDSMETIKKILVGISISLFGICIAPAAAYFGWGISFIGMIISIVGYFQNDK